MNDIVDVRTDISHNVSLKIGEIEVSLPIHDGDGKPGGFAFGLHKAGSTLLFKALRKLTNKSGTAFFDFEAALAKVGIDLRSGEIANGAADSLPREQQDILNEFFCQTNMVFGGWRIFPTKYALPLTAETSTLLLVLDPRDCLTSYYFSVKYSHTTEGVRGAAILKRREAMQNIAIDDFAKSMADQVARRFAEYETALSFTDKLILRYEDIIFSKQVLLKELCAHFQIDVRPARISRIAADLDEQPDKEDIHSHVRRVTPGDHKEKLKPETVSILNERFSSILSRYGYA